MTVLQTIAVAFAMFSALPVPQFEWNEKNMRYAMCAFPLIGLVCGGLWCLCGVLPLPELARAAAFCLVPVAVTGGIHLDGYADTSDVHMQPHPVLWYRSSVSVPQRNMRCIQAQQQHSQTKSDNP